MLTSLVYTSRGVVPAGRFTQTTSLSQRLVDEQTKQTYSKMTFSIIVSRWWYTAPFISGSIFIFWVYLTDNTPKTPAPSVI